MTEDQYLSLCEKYLRGEHTPEEEILIKKYQFDNGLLDEHLANIDIADQERLRALLRHKLQASLHLQEAPVVKIRRWSYAAAAAVLLFASAGIYFIKSNKKGQDNQVAITNNIAKKDIGPGSDKAVLTLANGNTITLGDAQNGVLSKQGNAAISKSGNGIVISKSDENKKHDADNAMNTIAIPRGGKYNITLADGTKVWLNSASVLSFPAAFSGTERKVTLTGEAYFEVAKNKTMPFKIDVNGKEVVEVLGTHFNVSAYTDEQSISTTLLEGSVKINYQNRSTLIKPGQMAVNNPNEGVTVKQANIEEVMAWKNDSFIFNNENITTIMKKISRWYDVDVVFKGDMTNVNFYGNYSRSKGLASLLKNIELVNKVRFITEERRVTVIAK
ncbi:FecR protein [Mucilaginibacter gossypiicola]|uniref:FecR protein n=1 Tax=Mucilaginibacter gossypiicola TaxID=551995 RepID=A0A1H8REW3_9SPHI|nr:FecR family protein [Mucilaginibacter gossypiicola]SEO64688.1 FecR protein [Mucilaginibacter gossypiicola]